MSHLVRRLFIALLIIAALTASFWWFSRPKPIAVVASEIDRGTMVINKNAVALVTRQLEMPLGAPKAYSTSYDGFGLRVVQGYDQKTKTDTVSIDMLCGVKTLSPELAAVIADKR